MASPLLFASLFASSSTMFPATAALEQYQKDDNDSSFPEMSFPAEFGTDSLFDQVLAMESPFAEPFPTIAWPSEETPSVSNTSTTSTKKSLHKAMRRTKHRSMIRCKSYHRSLSDLKACPSLCTLKLPSPPWATLAPPSSPVNILHIVYILLFLLLLMDQNNFPFWTYTPPLLWTVNLWNILSLLNILNVLF